MSGNLGETTTHESPKVIGIVGRYFTASPSNLLILDGTHGDLIKLAPTDDVDVILQPEATRNGVVIEVGNDSAYSVAIKDDTGQSLIATIGPKSSARFICTGTAWLKLASAKAEDQIWMSDVVTATNTDMTIPHTLGAAPTKVWWSVKAGHNNLGAAGDKCPDVDLTGQPDATNIYVSASEGSRLIFYAAL